MNSAATRQPDKQPHAISAMFDRVAGRYDLTNTVLTGGIDRWWRRNLRRAVALQPNETCLDLAAGTAVSTTQLAATGAYVVACDFSVGMLRAAADRSVPRVAGDALNLPFADGVFDAVTIAFGLRNVADPVRALREMARVTRPGGRLVVCEFSRPPFPPFRAAYGWHLRHVLPRVARLVSSDTDAYRYLGDSIEAWPDQPGLARLMSEAGWSTIGWRNLTGGVVALHRATRSE